MQLVRGQISGTTKAVILGAAVFLGVFDHLLYGWGRTVFSAGIALLVPVIGYRKFWRLARFWITAILVAIAQVPVVMLVQPQVEKTGFMGALMFAASACFLITLAFAWVCSESR